jgi:hypothetical protein
MRAVKSPMPLRPCAPAPLQPSALSTRSSVLGPRSSVLGPRSSVVRDGRQRLDPVWIGQCGECISATGLDEWDLGRRGPAYGSARSVSATLFPGIPSSTRKAPDFSPAAVCRRYSRGCAKARQHIPLLELSLGNSHAPMDRQHSTHQLTLSTWMVDRTEIGGIEILVPCS